MAFKVQVGPAQIAIHQGQSVLLTEPDGQVNWPSNRGLYFRDTRVISAWAIYANGEPWDLLNGGAIAPHAARIFQTNRAFVSEDGPIAARTLGLVIGRHIEGGLHEDVDITNNSQRPVRFNLEIAIRADFADIFEVKSDGIVRRGRITTSWSDKRQVLRITYSNRDFCREVIVRTGERRRRAGRKYQRASELRRRTESWASLASLLDLRPGGWREAHPGAAEMHLSSATSDHAGKINEWQRAVLKIDTSNEEFYRCYNQGIQDMAALRLPLKGTDHMVFVPAAGLPWFVALFGRDTLIVSLQTMIVYPGIRCGRAGGAGGVSGDRARRLSRRRAGQDATPLYLVALHAAWRATGDRSLIERHLPNAEACLTWIDKYGDRDGDGFQEYQTRSTAGYENVAWKDSGDAVMYPDGTLVRGPKALCELQGYVYDAWLRMAEIYGELGNNRRANVLREGRSAVRKVQRGFLGRTVRLLCFRAGRRQEEGVVADAIDDLADRGVASPWRRRGESRASPIQGLPEPARSSDASKGFASPGSGSGGLLSRSKSHCGASMSGVDKQWLNPVPTIAGGRRDDVAQAADADIETRRDRGLDKLKGRVEAEINVPTASRRRTNRRRHFLRRAAEEADEIGAALLAFGDVDVHHQDPGRQREPDVGGLVFRPRLRDDGGVGRGARKAMLEEALDLDRRLSARCTEGRRRMRRSRARLRAELS